MKIYSIPIKVGEDETDCVPFLSEYTDCSEANICTGCTKCSCSAEGQWQCQAVHECPGSGDQDVVDADSISNAYQVLFNELSNMESTTAIPLDSGFQPEGSRLLDNYDDIEEQHEVSIVKRSVSQNTSELNHNETVKFYHTVNELNEDTLKNTNESGTIEAKKVDGAKVPKISRRTSVVDAKNITGISDLHIDFQQPKDYDHHIVDNKIDSLVSMKINEDKNNFLNPSKISEVIGNHSQTSKDKDLSQLVVNELQKGSETIGNKQTTPVSNITFTPENDTLAAMAYIAGDLLSKLWKIEKDSSVESMETEVLKHEKLADLLELFKEPLTMRQELFIKNALERLSKALDKDRKFKNVSLCETLASSESLLGNLSNANPEDVIGIHTNCKHSNDSTHKDADSNSENNTVEAIAKIKTVINLVRKFENVEFKLNRLRNSMHTLNNDNNTQDTDAILSKDESKSLNVFGNLLEKITKLLLPKKSKKTKKFMTKIRHMNLFGNSEDIKKELKQIMGIDSENLNLTSKDKLVIDYLNIFKMNPECMFRGMSQKDTSVLPSTKGDTYTNIAKLLKVKSMDDIIELIAPSTNINTKNDSLPQRDEEPKNITTEANIYRNNLNDNKKDEKFNSIKDKLKIHISAIFEDLQELQKQSGFLLKEQNDIVNILPCLYNIFHSSKGEIKEITKVSKEPNLNNISLIFESFRNNLVGGPVSRRKDVTLPGSTKVWERVIKNLNKKSKENTRRNFKSELSFPELKQVIENVDLSSNSYKEYVSLANVPISSQLILLKVIQASVQQLANALENIKLFMETIIQLPVEEEFIIKEFLDSAVRSVNLNNRIFNKLKTYKKQLQHEDHNDYRVEPIYKQSMRLSEYNAFETPTRDRYEEKKFVDYNPRSVFTNNKFVNQLESPSYTIGAGEVSRSQSLNYKQSTRNQEVEMHNSNNFKLTRDEILNQLIKNRVELYMRIKEAKGLKLNLDINYNLARRIKAQLENGNYGLAKELFAVFISNAAADMNNFSPKNLFKGTLQNNFNKDAILQLPSTNWKNPRTDVKFVASDGLLQQLKTLKEMNL